MSKADEPTDARRFRDTVGLFATGVAVIVARADQEVLAMTANAVSSVSLEPQLVLFCPGKRSKLAGHIARLSGFTINILRDDQQALSTYFAGGWKETQPPPFRLVPSQCAPRLEGSLASIGCEPHQLARAGSEQRSRRAGPYLLRIALPADAESTASSSAHPLIRTHQGTDGPRIISVTVHRYPVRPSSRSRAFHGRPGPLPAVYADSRSLPPP